MNVERQPNRLTDGAARIERRKWVLLDQLNGALKPKRPARRAQDFPLEAHRSGGRLEEPEDQAAESRFARARFADDRMTLPVLDGNRHVFKCDHFSAG